MADLQERLKKRNGGDLSQVSNIPGKGLKRDGTKRKERSDKKQFSGKAVCTNSTICQLARTVSIAKPTVVSRLTSFSMQRKISCAHMFVRCNTLSKASAPPQVSAAAVIPSSADNMDIENYEEESYSVIEEGAVDDEYPGVSNQLLDNLKFDSFEDLVESEAFKELMQSDHFNDLIWSEFFKDSVQLQQFKELAQSEHKRDLLGSDFFKDIFPHLLDFPISPVEEWEEEN
jgi:hypothetical protein